MFSNSSHGVQLELLLYFELWQLLNTREERNIELKTCVFETTCVLYLY